MELWCCDPDQRILQVERCKREVLNDCGYDLKAMLDDASRTCYNQSPSCLSGKCLQCRTTRTSNKGAESLLSWWHCVHNREGEMVNPQRRNAYRDVLEDLAQSMPSVWYHEGFKQGC